MQSCAQHYTSGPATPRHSAAHSLPVEDERAKQTTVVWQSADPVWDEQLVFRDVCAASELVVELWDLGGTRSTSQLNRLTQNPSGGWDDCGWWAPGRGRTGTWRCCTGKKCECSMC